MATAPATLEASRIANCYSCFPNHSIECRDVEQAYITSKFEGPPTYVQLPRELWTPEMHKMRFPVVRLDKSLYGHKNSGAYWDKHCDTQLRKIGFEPVGNNWPGVYWHEANKQLLVRYVDDLELAGPTSKNAVYVGQNRKTV